MSMAASSQDGVPLLDVLDVFKIFEVGGERMVALRGTTLQVQQGEFVALLGRSGSGKSTLLNIIAGLDTVSAGKEFLAGNDVTGASEDERARLRREVVGIVLQRDNLIPYLTAEENVALPLRLAGANDALGRARGLLTRVGLQHRMRHKAHQLSGGEAQRVSIAVALAPGPKLLLGDEITGELDSATAAGVLDVLTELHQGEQMGMIIVTHDPVVASRAQRVLHMQDGRIAAAA
jgi:putative ABC transport system ATP-binding protein